MEAVDLSQGFIRRLGAGHTQERLGSIDEKRPQPDSTMTRDVIRAPSIVRIVAMCGVVALALALGHPIAYSQPVAPEYQIKASYLYNFIQFISWPEETFGRDGKFNLCVVGAERFGSALDGFVGEQIEGHEIVLRRLENAQTVRVSHCHLLFIAAGHTDPTSNEAISERGLLTIGETSGFLERGGVINLVEVRGRIRFEINQGAAKQAGLVVSSRILSLAVNKP